jgi:hypothetical protein
MKGWKPALLGSNNDNLLRIAKIYFENGYMRSKDLEPGGGKT